MKWYRDLYISKKLARKRFSLMKRIEAGKRIGGLFLVTISAHPDNQLEIMDARYLFMTSLRERLPMIVGLAESYGEATEILLKIVEDAEQAGMRGQLKQYLLEQEGII